MTTLAYPMPSSASPSPGGRQPLLGIALTTRLGLRPDELGPAAALAERSGFSHVFVNEAGNDAIAAAAGMLAATRRIRVGTGIANIYLRHPVLTAASATTLSGVSGGRFVLGLGTGHRRENESRYGITMTDRPLEVLAEHAEVVRRLLGQPSASFAGRHYPIDDAELVVPRSGHVPIVFATLGQVAARLSGRLADGMVLTSARPPT